VEGGANAKPAVSFPTPMTVTSTTVKVVVTGTGPVVAAGQTVTADYVLLNGRDGKELDTSFGKKPQAFTVDPTKLFPGLVTGLTGQKVGSRVVVVIPPKDAFGDNGNSQLDIRKDDTVVFLLDIKSLPLTKATGTAVPPKPGFPTARIAANGKPTITVPATKPPTKLAIEPMIVGTGPVVTKGQSISVNYTGVVWPGGKEFDSSFKTGKPADFSIGVGQVVKGWDEGLVGQRVGSRVMLVLPPAWGYGKAGQPQAGIKGTDTLVFVIDILGAA
jgi:peptidylprolyl isomerase